MPSPLPIDPTIVLGIRPIQVWGLLFIYLGLMRRLVRAIYSAEDFFWDVTVANQWIHSLEDDQCL